MGERYTYLDVVDMKRMSTYLLHLSSLGWLRGSEARGRCPPSCKISHRKTSDVMKVSAYLCIIANNMGVQTD